MASYKFPGQNNLNWAESFSMTAKVPAIANRIFETLDDAQEYVNDVNSTAIEGLILSVIKDSTNNGSYFVSKVGTVSDPVGVLVKLAASSVSDDLAGDLVNLQNQLNGCDYNGGAGVGTNVKVSIVQENGKITSVSVNEEALNTAISSAESNANSYTDGKVNELKDSLSNALHFLGVSSTDPSTGVVTIGGTEVSEFSDGDIVIFGSKEFVRSNAAWEELGDVTGVSELLTWNEE